MTITIDQNLFWTIIAAMLAYNVIMGFIASLGDLIARRPVGAVNSFPTNCTGAGPGGMVVKNRDSLGSAKAQEPVKE